MSPDPEFPLVPPAGFAENISRSSGQYRTPLDPVMMALWSIITTPRPGDLTVLPLI